MHQGVTLPLLPAPLASLCATPVPGQADTWFFVDSETPIHSVWAPTERMLWHQRFGHTQGTSTCIMPTSLSLVSHLSNTMTPISMAVPPVSRLKSARNRPVHTLPRRLLRSFKVCRWTFPFRELALVTGLDPTSLLACMADVLHPGSRPSHWVLPWRHGCLQSFSAQLASTWNPFPVLRWKIRVPGPRRRTLLQPSSTPALRQIHIHSPTNWCRFFQSKWSC
jgi:hypothetical protein